MVERQTSVYLRSEVAKDDRMRSVALKREDALKDAVNAVLDSVINAMNVTNEDDVSLVTERLGEALENWHELRTQTWNEDGILFLMGSISDTTLVPVIAEATEEETQTSTPPADPPTEKSNDPSPAPPTE